MEEREEKLRARYGKSENGNYGVIDTIGTPHPFIIMPSHVNHAQKFGGMLTKECIEDLEKTLKRPSCGARNCKLKFEEHKSALLVACKKDMKDEDGKVDPELESYLKKVVLLAEEDKHDGFAFIQKE